METQLVVTTAADAHAEAVRLVGPIHHVCPRCGASDHGRPVAATGHVSLARDGDRAVVAAAPVPIGVDVQRAGSVGDAALAAADLPPSDDPTRAWVVAEAVGKLTGQGLRGALPDAEVVVLELDDLVVAVATWEPVTVAAATSRAATGAAAPPRPAP